MTGPVGVCPGDCRRRDPRRVPTLGLAFVAMVLGIVGTALSGATMIVGIALPV
ncbi:hypothetical protein [Erwinia endophytica]|uniref:hypothetical protein n=1 Tax=Erwinia endophytica TaxID=1563158 RepID=UPI00186B59EE|nr:hypothetical protein [Erwinia endophytica]